MPTDLRSRNLSNIINTICRKKFFTVSDIHHTTKISKQTIGKVLSELVELNVIVQTGKGFSTNTGGKRPDCYALNDQAYVICSFSCGHRTGFSLMTLSYTKLDEIELDFLEPKLATRYSPEAYVATMAEACRKLIRRNHIDPKKLLGIALGFGGIVDEEKGIVRVSSQVPEWDNEIELRRMLLDALQMDVLVTVDNVSRISARTMVSHENINQKTVVVIYCDYGIGVTCVEQGQVRQTAHNVGNEMGHMVIDPWDTEICGCGGRGCFERLVSEKRVFAKIDALPPVRRLAVLEGWNQKTDIRVHVVEKSEQGNEDAKAIEQYLIEVFGVAIRNIYLGVDPDYIVIQGEFARFPQSFLEASMRKAQENRYIQVINPDIRPYNRPLQELQEVGNVNTLIHALLGEQASQSE